MLQQLTIDLADAQRGISAAISQAQLDSRPMAVAVVDANGDLISCGRMDGAHERILRFAIRKAYTAAIMGRETSTFQAELSQHSRTLADYSDPQFTTLQGGLPVKLAGRVVGGIAVGGNTPERDKAIAAIAAQAIVDGLDSATAERSA